MNLLQRFKNIFSRQYQHPNNSALLCEPKACITSTRLEKSLIDKFIPQLGEITCHALTVDPRIVKMTTAHFQSIVAAIDKYALKSSQQRPLRFLEIGANAHYTAQLLTKELGVDGTALDISPNALRYGQRLAKEQGIEDTATLVACDFHNIPFHDDFFDVVFIASAVHHTRKPQIVLKECLRVLSANGLFILEDEPCARLFSFFKFHSNREDSFTPFEKLLADKGLLRIVTSPFVGDRYEQLFGMIENNDIPLLLYLNTITAFAKILETSINDKVCMSSFDHELVANAHLNKEDLAKVIEERLLTEFAESQQLIGQREQLLGFSLPEAKEIAVMSQKVATALKALPSEKEPIKRTQALADLFGATLCLIAQRKKGGEESNERFSRQMIQQDGVWHEELSDSDYQIKVSEPLLSDIQRAPPEEIFQRFIPDEWEYLKEGNGSFSMLNLNVTSRVKAPPIVKNAILLVRFFAVIEKTQSPYRVLVFYGNKQVDELLICQSETRFVRVFIDKYEEFISFKSVDLNGNPLLLIHHLRIGVLQMIPLVTNMI